MKNNAAGLIKIRAAVENENIIQFAVLLSIIDRIRYELLIRRKHTNRDSDNTENSRTRQNVDDINTEMAIAK